MPPLPPPRLSHDLLHHVRLHLPGRVEHHRVQLEQRFKLLEIELAILVFVGLVNRFCPRLFRVPIFVPLVKETLLQIAYFVLIDESVNVTIKDMKELHADSPEQDQTHYQDLEYFNIDNLIEEELALIYPDIVKCDRKCLEKEETLIEEKNLPFKKIRDLID